MRFLVPSTTEMSVDVLKKYITKHKYAVQNRNAKLQDAYENRYAIYNLPGKEEWKPDNRVSVNFAKYITDTFNGFFCGIPIKSTSDQETVEKQLNYINTYNDIDEHNAEVSKLMDIHGDAHELYYVDENKNICIAYMSPMQSFFICDDSILERPLYFVRYYYDSSNKLHGSWSDSAIVQHFVDDGGIHWDGDPVLHGFAGVPATEFTENDEHIGLFESAMPAIDAYNKALSEKANDVDYFADAYLKVLGPKVEEGDLHSIRSNRVINFEGDLEQVPVVDFLTKPNADETQEHLLGALERLIFKQCMVADISDDAFGTSSGIALRYKLLAMSNLFKSKERRFTAGLNRRYKILFSNALLRMDQDAWTSINYTFTPNYPANIQDEVSSAAQASGIVSHETQLSMLSFVPDPKIELDKITSEDNESMDSVLNGTAFGGGTLNGAQTASLLNVMSL